jgi:hypothetical protein
VGADSGVAAIAAQLRQVLSDVEAERRLLAREREAMRAEEQRFRDDLASKGVHVLTDPAEIAANRAWVEMDADVAGAIRHVLEVADRYSDADLSRLTRDRLWPQTLARAERAAAYLTHLQQIAPLSTTTTPSRRPGSGGGGRRT